MNTLTRDQRMAALVLPILFFGVLGISTVSAHEGAQSRENKYGMSESRKAIHTALESNNYEAFLEATENSPFEGEVDQSMFQVLVDAYSLQDAGDTEGARALLTGD